MKTIMLMILTTLFFTTSCKNKDIEQDNKLNAYPYFELNLKLKSVLENYMDLAQKEDSLIKFYYLELVEMDQNHLIFRFTSKRNFTFIENHPPLRFTMINNKYILFGISDNKQIISDIKKDPLYEKYKINLERDMTYNPMCWEIEIKHDSIINIDKTCSSWMKNKSKLFDHQ